MVRSRYPKRGPRTGLIANQERWRTQCGQQASSFDIGQLQDEVPEVRTGSNFVPSFSVVRFPTDIESVEAMRHRIGRVVKGYGFWVTKPEGLAVKALSQRRFIDLAREAGACPDASDMRDLAYALRGDLAGLLGDSPSGIALPLGQVSRFGYKNNVLGVEPLGWKGHGAKYAVRDESGNLQPVGILAAEGQLTMEALTLYMGKVEPQFDPADLATTPHVSICRRRSEIQSHDLRMARVVLAHELDLEILLGDPIIYFRPTPDEIEIIPVRGSQGLAA